MSNRYNIKYEVEKKRISNKLCLVVEFKSEFLAQMCTEHNPQITKIT